MLLSMNLPEWTLLSRYLSGMAVGRACRAGHESVRGQQGELAAASADALAGGAEGGVAVGGLQAHAAAGPECYTELNYSQGHTANMCSGQQCRMEGSKVAPCAAGGGRLYFHGAR